MRGCERKMYGNCKKRKEKAKIFIYQYKREVNERLRRKMYEGLSENRKIVLERSE